MWMTLSNICLIRKIKQRKLKAGTTNYRAFSLTWPALCKFIGTKESFYMRKEFNSNRISLEHQYGRRFIALEHQYGRRDVMWKRSTRTLYLSSGDRFAIMRQKFEPRGGPAMCRTQKKKKKKRRENIVVLRSEHWPHGGSNPEHPTLQISALPAGLNYTYL